jgi:leucyl aminopeptidase
MKVEFSAVRPASNDAIAVLVSKGGLAGGVLAGFNVEDAALLKMVAAAQRFEGDAGAVVEHFLPMNGATRRVLLAGTGTQSASDCEKAGAALSARLLTSGETSLIVDLSGTVLSSEARNRLVSGAVLRAWRHDIYRTKLPEKQKATLSTLIIVGAPAAAEAEWAASAAVIKGIQFTRGLVTEPANIIYPESFVTACEAVAALGVTIKVLDEHDMAALGMGALLGVAQGSARPPRLLVMEYDGTHGAQAKPIVFVGKGVTFDTGGISLKPPGGMVDMKWDMGGAGAVAGAMMALAGRKAKAHVVGVCGLVENMPDGKAQRPGDVVTSMSGQTIEVINTDAEGRLVLCDAITWVQKTYQPDVIVDLATLTGAIIISLGHEHGGLFSNDDGLAAQLTAAGAASGDPLWRFPLSPAYDKLIDSPIADIKNVGPREGGSITAAQFIQRFVNEGVKWAHLDIAGMVWASKPGAVWDKGATGYGVRLLDRFIADNYEG